MGEIADQYGKMILTVIAVIGIMSFIAGRGENGILETVVLKSAAELKEEDRDVVTEKETPVDRTAGIKAKTGLVSGCDYDVNELVEAEGDNITGGKILYANLVYDPLASYGENAYQWNLNEENLDDKKINFTKQGIYHLCIAVQCEDKKSVLTDVYAAVGECE